MAIAPKLQARQTQSLVMTPQLQQAIKLLQLSNIELAAFVEEQLESNPLLERGTGDENRRGEDIDASPSDIETGFDNVSLEAPAAMTADLDAPASAIDSEATVSELNTHTADVGGSVDWSKAGNGGSFNGSSDFNAADNRAAEKTLSEVLHEQMALAIHEPSQRMIAQNLIDCVDENGYMRAQTSDIAERLGVSVNRVDSLLTTLQTFEPTGVFARSLKECLSLQLRESGQLDTPMAALLVEPDVFIRETAQGGWAVELNSDNLPRVLVDNRYFAEICALDSDEETKMFMTECHQNANWLVKSLDQRARTILKVTTEIVKQQDGFFAYGVDHLRPLNLRTVADAIEMHESTVSRVTSNKYMSTPRGMFELKYFFTASIPSLDGGEAHSAEAVRHKIKILIDEETAKTVKSDDKLVDLLRAQGIDIARRTVAKYREAMGIPSSIERRRMFKHKL